MQLNNEKETMRIPWKVFLVSFYLRRHATCYYEDADENSRICDDGMRVVEYDVPILHLENDQIT
jgi:hypothetical protein